jgi:hypothetical protein
MAVKDVCDLQPLEAERDRGLIFPNTASEDVILEIPADAGKMLHDIDAGCKSGVSSDGSLFQKKVDSAALFPTPPGYSPGPHRQRRERPRGRPSSSRETNCA